MLYVCFSVLWFDGVRVEEGTRETGSEFGWMSFFVFVFLFGTDHVSFRLDRVRLLLFAVVIDSGVCRVLEMLHNLLRVEWEVGFTALIEKFV